MLELSRRWEHQIHKIGHNPRMTHLGCLQFSSTIADTGARHAPIDEATAATAGNSFAQVRGSAQDLILKSFLQTLPPSP